MILANRNEVLSQINVSKNCISKLDKFVQLVENERKIQNIIAESTLPDIWVRHVLDSAQLQTYLTEQNKIILDFGSGAGFPALVLAILDETKQKTFHLVESEVRKSEFLSRVASELDLNCVIHHERIEKMSVFKADVITARALASLDKLMAYSVRFCHEKTRLMFLKGKKAPEELKDVEKKFKFNCLTYPSISSSEGTVMCFTKVVKK